MDQERPQSRRLLPDRQYIELGQGCENPQGWVRA